MPWVADPVHRRLHQSASKPERIGQHPGDARHRTDAPKRRILPERRPGREHEAVIAGRRVDAPTLRAFVESLGLPDDARDRLLALTPGTYVGLAPQLADLLDRL